MIINNEDKLFLISCKPNIKEKDRIEIEKLILNVTDWDYFITNSIRNSVSQMIFRNFQKLNILKLIPENIAKQLENSYYKNLSRNILIYKCFFEFLDEFIKNDIKPIALKGIFLAENIYNDIGVRQMTDIDLLIKPSQIELSRDIMFGLGYYYLDRVKSKHITMHTVSSHLPQLFKDGVRVELHYKLDGDFVGIVEKMDDYWQNSIPISINNYNLLSLSIIDLINYLTIHLDKHFQLGKLQFYYYTDIIAILEFYKNDINWKQLDSTCEKIESKTNVYKQLFLINKFFNYPIPELILNQTKNYCSINDEELFVVYLKRDIQKRYNYIRTNNFDNLKNVKGVKGKIKYIVNDIFPPTAYMISRYRIKNKNFIVFYYLYRITIGAITLTKIVFKRKKKNGKSK